MEWSTIFTIPMVASALVTTLPAFSQFTYTPDQSIPVEVNGNTLAMPWAGGLNSPQFNTMDLNGDNKQDLVILDRSANKLMTFLNVNDAYRYAPDYERLFPAEINHWLILRDFNCDGKKDLFTSDPFGMKAFVNTTAPGELLTWKGLEFFTEPGIPKSDIVLTLGFSGKINLKVNEADMPAIDDLDGDGDLDILNVRFTGVGTIEYHKNFTIERYGHCDSLEFERVTQAFGGVEECTCGQFAFDQTCAELNGGGRTQHAGGKTLLTLDIDNDNDREVLFAEESCSRLFLMTNTGTSENALFTTAAGFPPSRPINFPIFPAAFLEDFDFDGNADLVAAPNAYARTFNSVLVERSVWLYKNTGTDQAPIFTFIGDNFLQDEMIEVGDYSVPAFLDNDGDGDLDLFVGFYANTQALTGSVYHFENIGTNNSPSFRLTTNDFAGLSFLGNFNFKPQVADVNGDARLDFVFTSTGLQNGITTLQYLINNADVGFSVGDYVITDFRIATPENLTVVDVNQDGRQDLLVGKSTGALQYWENNGLVGSFGNMVLKDGSYLGITTSPSRQNPVVTSADLDADGRGDLVVASNRGVLSLYGDFRNFDPTIMQPSTDIIFNAVTNSYGTRNLGGRVWPTVANIFNSDKPSIVLGNTLGGLLILRNDEGIELPPDPVINLFPNPVSPGEDLNINADRNVVLQVYSILGQKMSEPLFIQANQTFPLRINNVSPGMYIARFTVGAKRYSRKFVLR